MVERGTTRVYSKKQENGVGIRCGSELVLREDLRVRPAVRLSRRRRRRPGEGNGERGSAEERREKVKNRGRIHVEVDSRLLELALVRLERREKAVLLRRPHDQGMSGSEGFDRREAGRVRIHLAEQREKGSALERKKERDQNARRRDRPSPSSAPSRARSPTLTASSPSQDLPPLPPSLPK